MLVTMAYNFAISLALSLYSVLHFLPFLLDGDQLGDALVSTLWLPCIHIWHRQKYQQFATPCVVRRQLSITRKLT